jgi:hypothetical protein
MYRDTFIFFLTFTFALFGSEITAVVSCHFSPVSSHVSFFFPFFPLLIFINSTGRGGGETAVTNQNWIHERINGRLNSGSASCSESAVFPSRVYKQYD